MKKLWIVFLIPLILSGCGKNTTQWEYTDQDYMMIAHCEMMQMNGCEKYQNIDEQTRQKAIEIGCEMMPGMPICKEEEIIESEKKELDDRKPMETIYLKDGDTYKIDILPITTTIGWVVGDMLTYNGTIPWPLIKVQQGSNIDLEITNKVENIETTIHPHGLRLDNMFDGVPIEMWGTQEPLKFGESYTQTLSFPDPWIYWYHPHVQEDLQQDRGMYGVFIVKPTDKQYWNNIHREEVLVLDDILIQDNKLQSHTVGFTDFALMGRFGNTMLINGSDDYSLSLKQGESTRLYIVNVSNVRTYNFTIPGMQMKLVGSDIGKYQEEHFVDSVVIAPAERYIVEIAPQKPGTFIIENQTPKDTYKLGTIEVIEEVVEELAEHITTDTDIEKYKQYFDKPVDKVMRLSVELHGNHASHMEMMGGHAGNDGIEWEDEMGAMNAMMTPDDVDWKLVDDESKEENMDINWRFKQGDIVKVRIINDEDSMHPMQHPIHFHGQRFLIISRDGIPENNLAWKDTVLVPTGQTVDILLEMTNPGKWMAHCHIAEHLSAGMMMNFTVEEEMRIIDITASRFEFSQSEIIVKQGEKVKIRVEDTDTLHGIAIPDMQLISDTEVVLDTSKKWEFEFICANYCGDEHSDMKGKIIIK